MDIALNPTSGRRQDSYDAVGWLESHSSSATRLHAERGENARTAAQRRRALEPPLFFTSVRFTADFWARLADIGENEVHHMPTLRGKSAEPSMNDGASLSLGLGDASDLGREPPDDVSRSSSSASRTGRDGKAIEVGIIRGAAEYTGTGLPPILQPGAYLGVDGMGMGMGMGIRANMGPNGKVMPLAWRMRDRMKTSCVALILCLNIGTDPPDVRKPKPCAVTECWTDPRGATAHKALVAIGKALQGQYERLQPRARYRQSLDPTAEDARKLCASLRRSARRDRVLLHYNGHGVPRPTPNGEIWVFNKNYTQYIPLSVHEMQQWVGRPAVYVFDCSNAGVLLPHFLQNAAAGGGDGPGVTDTGAVTPDDSGTSANAAPAPAPSMANGPNAYSVIVLAACGANELLPMNPDQPADLFTACLTTPIIVALRWFVSRNPMSMGGLSPDAVLRIPGKLTDRKTPLGELNWVFTAVTDTIAWNTLPQQLFQRLFRQDLLVASLFRNFLLAERVMNAFRCTPTSIPALPQTHHHPLWQAWDVAAEVCLSKLLHAGVFGQVEGVVPMNMQVDDHDIDVGTHNGGHPVGGLGIGTGMSVPAPMGMGLSLAGGANAPGTPRRAARTGREPLSPARFGRGHSHDRGGGGVSSTSGLSSGAKDSSTERGGGGKMTVSEAACEMAENAARHGNISVRVGAAATATSRGAATFATAAAAAMAVVASPGGAGSSVVSPVTGTSSASGALPASSSVTLAGSNATTSAPTPTATVPGSSGAAHVTPNPAPLPQLVVTVTPSSFFAEQLTAFEQWLVFGAEDAAPPEQLPIVLQVLLSQAHRLRALLLLRRFLDLGPWASGLALSVGIFPYVLKLLQSPAPELRQVLVCIWAKLLAVDPSCRAELLKEGAHVHFVAHLRELVPDAKQSGGDSSTAWRVGARSSTVSALGPNVHADGSVLPPLQRVMAVFILTSLMESEGPGDESAAKSAASSSSPSSKNAESAKRNKGRALCLEQGLHIVCLDILASVRSRPRTGSSVANNAGNSSERVGTGARGSLGTSASSLFGSDASDGVFASTMSAANEGVANSTEQRISRATQALQAAEPAVLRCWVLLALSSLLDSFPEARQAMLRETNRRSALRRRGAQRNSSAAAAPGTSVPVASANAETSSTSASYSNAQAQSAPGFSKDSGVDAKDLNNRRVADDESVLGSELLGALRDVDPNVRAAASGVVGALFGCPFSPPTPPNVPTPSGATGMYGLPSPDPTPAVSPKSSSPKTSLRKIYLPPGGAPPLSVPIMNVQASEVALKGGAQQPPQQQKYFQQQERRQRRQQQSTTQSGQAKPPLSAVTSPPPQPSRRLGTHVWNASSVPISSSPPLHGLNLWHPAVPTIADATMAVSLIWACTDCSPLVRHEAVLALARLVLRPRFIGTFAAIAQEVLWRYRAAVSAARGEAEPPSPITPATIPSDTDSHPGEEDDSAAGSDSDALHANAMLNAELSPHLGPTSAVAVAPSGRPPDMPLPAQAEADVKTAKSHARTKSKGVLGVETSNIKSSAADAKSKHRRKGSAKSTPLIHSGVQIGKSIAFALFSSLSSHSHCWLQAGLNEVRAEADCCAPSQDKTEAPPVPAHQSSDPPRPAAAEGSRPHVHMSGKRSKTQHDFSSVSAAVDAAAAEAAQTDSSFLHSAASIGGASPTRWAGHEETVAVLEELASVWSAIKVVAARDPFPMVSTAARTIVRRVHSVMRRVEEAAAMAAAEEQESKRGRRGDEGDASDDERASQGSRTGDVGTRPRIFSRAMSPSAEDDNGTDAANFDEQISSEKMPSRRLGGTAVDAVKMRAAQAARTQSLGEDDAPTRTSSTLPKHNSELRVDTSRKSGSTKGVGMKGRGGLLDDMRRSLRRTMSQREPGLTERQRTNLHAASSAAASSSTQASTLSKKNDGGQMANAVVAPPVTSPDAVPSTKSTDMVALQKAIGAQLVPVQIQPPSGALPSQAGSQVHMPPQVQRQAQLQAHGQTQVLQRQGFAQHAEHVWSAFPPDPEPRLPRLLKSQLFACWRLGFLSPMLAENFDVDSVDDPLSEAAASAMIRWRRNERVRSDAITMAQTMLRRQRRKVGALAGGGSHVAATNVDSLDDRDNARGHRRAASSIGSARLTLHKRNRSVESFAESSTERSAGSSTGRGSSVERGSTDGRDWGERTSGRDRETGGTRMVQSAILDNDAEMTSLLLFHAYESALVVADERDGISIWNYRAGEKACSFSNTNATGSRVTTLGWMNENAEDALLYVGSDDGVVRVWSSLKFTPANRNKGSGSGNSHGNDSDDEKDADESTQRFSMGVDDEAELSQRRKTFNSSRQQRRGPGPRSALHKYSRSTSLYASVCSAIGETSTSIGARSTADLFSTVGLTKIGSKGADADDRDRTIGAVPAMDGSSGAAQTKASDSDILAHTEDGYPRKGTGGHVGRGSGWRDGGQKQRLVSAFFAVPSLAPSLRGSGLVALWDQPSGSFVAGGNSDTLYIWDLGHEQCSSRIPTSTDSCVTSLAVSCETSSFLASASALGASPASGSFAPSTTGIGGLAGGLLIAGCGDGSIRAYDQRLRPEISLCATFSEHRAWVVHCSVQRDGTQMVSGSVQGDVVFWDLRGRAPVSVFEVHRSPMTALSVHSYAPLFASGSHNQFIKVFDFNGDVLSTIRYHDGFLGQRIGPVSSLAFHPHKPLLAAGATDSIVSIYSTVE